MPMAPSLSPRPSLEPPHPSEIPTGVTAALGRKPYTMLPKYRSTKAAQSPERQRGAELTPPSTPLHRCSAPLVRADAPDTAGGQGWQIRCRRALRQRALNSPSLRPSLHAHSRNTCADVCRSRASTPSEIAKQNWRIRAEFGRTRRNRFGPGAPQVGDSARGKKERLEQRMLCLAGCHALELQVLGGGSRGRRRGSLRWVSKEAGLPLVAHPCLSAPLVLPPPRPAVLRTCNCEANRTSFRGTSASRIMINIIVRMVTRRRRCRFVRRMMDRSVAVGAGHVASMAGRGLGEHMCSRQRVGSRRLFVTRMRGPAWVGLAVVCGRG